jgi:hypothetical protein
MASFKKLKGSSQPIQKPRRATKPTPSPEPAPQFPDVNRPRSQRNAMTKSTATQLERKMDRPSSETENGGALAERISISKLARSYTGMLGRGSFMEVATSIVDPKNLQTKSGLQEEEILRAAHDSFAEFVYLMRPRDPLEKLTLEQLMLHHARVVRLSQEARRQSVPKLAKLFHEACDGASGAFRRLMIAFNENRKPPRQQAAIAIDQANVANQQVV